MADLIQNLLAALTPLILAILAIAGARKWIPPETAAPTADKIGRVLKELGALIAVLMGTIGGFQHTQSQRAANIQAVEALTKVQPEHKEERMLQMGLKPKS